MKAYITSNINLEDYQEELDSLTISSSDSPNWIYKGSLAEHTSDIPLNVKSLIPLKYFLKHGTKPYEPLGEEIIPLTFTLESASEVMSTIISRLDTFEFKAAFDDIKRYISLVAVELVRNGIIQNIKSNLKKEVKLTISESKRDIIIKVTDFHGEFESIELIKRLKKITATGEYERKEHGAGLGLFMVVSSVSTINFNTKKGKQTEITCTINKYKRLKHFKQKETAIFFS